MSAGISISRESNVCPAHSASSRKRKTKRPSDSTSRDRLINRFSLEPLMYQTVLRKSLIPGLLNWISTTASSLRIGLTPC